MNEQLGRQEDEEDEAIQVGDLAQYHGRYLGIGGVGVGGSGKVYSKQTAMRLAGAAPLHGGGPWMEGGQRSTRSPPTSGRR